LSGPTIHRILGLLGKAGVGMHLKYWLGIVLGLVCMAGTPAQAEPRIALVIGNAHYSAELGELQNPGHDAELMGKTLAALGFDVMTVVDVDQKKLRRAFNVFSERLVSAGPTATGLFFYAGHGVSIGGQSYLIPINAEIAREADVELEAVALGDVLEQLEFVGNATNIVIVDASQNNPLARNFRSHALGLSRLDADFPGTFISFSAAPGTLAEDGHGAHSPFVTALAESIATPDLSIHDLFDTVRRKVLEITKDRQLTWDASTLTAPFYFVWKQ
jgi:uncharacterized caspase-like protein